MGNRSCIDSLKIMIYITGFSLILILFIQSLHRKIPTITLEEFYVSTLNKTATNTSTATNKNTTIYFDLKLYNKNAVGIDYRPMNLTISYFPNKTTSVPLCVYTLRGFHQKHHKENHVRDKVVSGGIMTLHGGVERVVVMRVDLVGRVKFKSIAQWKRTVMVGVDLDVDEYTGEKVLKSGVHLLRSGVPPLAVVAAPVAMMLVFSCLFNLMFL